MNHPNELGAAVLVALVLLGLVLAVLWIVLPFAVFSIRRLMKETLAAQLRTNKLLEQLGGVSRRADAPGSPADRA